MHSRSNHRSLPTSKWRVSPLAIFAIFAVVASGLGLASYISSQAAGVSGSKDCNSFVTLGGTITCNSTFTNTTNEAGGTLGPRTDTILAPASLAGTVLTSPTQNTPRVLSAAGGGSPTSPADTWTFQVPNDPTLCGQTVGDTVSAQLTLDGGFVSLPATASGASTVVCANIAITPATATNAVDTNHVLTITVKALGGTLAAGTATATIESGPGSFVGSPSCAYAAPPAPPAAVQTSSCQVTITSAATGTTVVSATSSIGTLVGPLVRTTNTVVNTQQGGSGNASKDWVNANIQITPATATNAVNTNHVLTITVNALPGSATIAAGTATANIVSGPGSFVGSPSCNYPAGGATSNCTVTITSAVTGQTVVGATSNISVSGQTITRTTNTAVNTAAGGSGNASKDWVNANIQITPANATNPLNTNHVLTITVNALPGTASLAAGTATASIVSGPGSFVGSPTCNYPAGGATSNCTVTITSGTPGTTVVDATSLITVSGQAITRTTNTAVNTAAGGSGNANKLWEDTTVEVIKVCTNGVLAGNVTLEVGAFTVAKNCPTGGTTGAKSVTPGQQIAVGETAVPAGFTATLGCMGGVTVGTAATATGNTNITPPQGTATVCTVTNTPIPTTVEVIKVCSDPAAAGNVTLEVGAFTVAKNCPTGGTTGAKDVTPGVQIAVGETAVPTGFTATIGCIGGVSVSTAATTTGNINITPLAGTATVCTVTNTFVPVATLTTTSNPTGSGVAVGTSVKDQATVSGTGPTPTGTITFFLCQPGTVSANGGDCSSGGAQVGGAVALVAGVATSAASTDTLVTGKYCWRAVYSGDAVYDPASHTNGGSECFTVKVDPDLTVTKELKPGQPAPSAGGRLYYLVRVKNIGGTATPPPPNIITMIDTPPAGTTIVNWTIISGSGRCSIDGLGRLVCDLGGSMAPGAETVVEVVIRTPKSGSLTNTAEVDPFKRIQESNEANNKTTLVTVIP